MFKKDEIVRFFWYKATIKATKNDPCLDPNPANVPLFPPQDGNIKYDYLISIFDKNSNTWSGAFPCLESQLRPWTEDGEDIL